MSGLPSPSLQKDCVLLHRSEEVTGPRPPLGCHRAPWALCLHREGLPSARLPEAGLSVMLSTTATGEPLKKHTTQQNTTWTRNETNPCHHHLQVHGAGIPTATLPKGRAEPGCLQGGGTRPRGWGEGGGSAICTPGCYVTGEHAASETSQPMTRAAREQWSTWPSTPRRMLPPNHTITPKSLSSQPQAEPPTPRQSPHHLNQQLNLQSKTKADSQPSILPPVSFWGGTAFWGCSRGGCPGGVPSPSSLPLPLPPHQPPE